MEGSILTAPSTPSLPYSLLPVSWIGNPREQFRVGSHNTFVTKIPSRRGVYPPPVLARDSQ